MAGKSTKHKAQSTEPAGERDTARTLRHVHFLLERRELIRSEIRKMVKAGALDERVVAYLVELGWESMLMALSHESNTRMIDRVHLRALEDRDERLAQIGCVGVIHRVHGKAHDDFRELEAAKLATPAPIQLTTEPGDLLLKALRGPVDVKGGV